VIQPRFLPAAEADLLEEIAYYSNAGEGLGIRFQAAVTAAVKKAAARPDSGAPSSNGTCRRLVKGFPFSVVYRASDSELLVVAVAHHRRQPGYWSGRIEHDG
jgi:plasmid stabilization system protein ParE